MVSSIGEETYPPGLYVPQPQGGTAQEEEFEREMYYGQAQPWPFWNFPPEESAAAIGASFLYQQMADPWALGADGTFAGEGWQHQRSKSAAWEQKERARLAKLFGCEGGQAWVPPPERPGDEKLAEQLLSQLEEGGDALVEVRAALEKPGTVKRLSFQSKGCRAVQKALEVLDRAPAARLARGLEGSILQAVKCRFANHVILVIIKQFRTDDMFFVLTELWWCFVELANQQYGCRVLCKLLEEHMDDERIAYLMNLVLLQAEWLVRDRYGCHVMEHVLEYGRPDQKQVIVHVLREKLLKNAQDKYASFVFTKALNSCEYGGALAQDLLCQKPLELAATFSKSTGLMVGKELVKQRENFVVQRLAEKLQSPEAKRRLMASRGRELWELLWQQLKEDNAEPA